jgi:hypothetical protein
VSTHNDVDISEGNEFDAIYSDDKQISDGDSLQPSDCLCSTMQCLGSGLETEKSYNQDVDLNDQNTITSSSSQD